MSKTDLKYSIIFQHFNCLKTELRKEELLATLFFGINVVPTLKLNLSLKFLYLLSQNVKTQNVDF